jgi:hypothetical protein
MNQLNVNFVHPTDGRVVTASLDPSMTVQEIISELVANSFIKHSEHGYNLAVKGGNRLRNHQTLAEAGVTDNMTLRIIPATDAGF